jgi:sterol desaturase/sphingolipid hydroxylase (fatty acid hydroxylase superfamily)
VLLDYAGLLLGFAVLAAVFGLVEQRSRARGAPPWWRRRDVATDLAWWATVPLVARVVGALVLVAVAAAVVPASGRSVASLREEVAAGRFPDLGVLGLGPTLRAWPFAVQLVVGLLVSDLVGYGTHRLFHRRPLWSFHAVHHSSPRLDWVSAVRVHPLNEVLSRAALGSTLLLVGFDPRVFAVVAPLLTAYALLLHADVGWTYGPLRFVVASPAFHRWHHAADREAWGKNFAGLFSFVDVLFGTFHCPRDSRPRAIGAPSTRVPARFLAQLAYPVRRARPGERLAAEAAS